MTQRRYGVRRLPQPDNQPPRFEVYDLDTGERISLHSGQAAADAEANRLNSPNPPPSPRFSPSSGPGF